MPACTTLFAKDFKRQRIYHAASRDELYRVQQHPRDPLALLVRLRFPDRRRVLPIAVANELLCSLHGANAEFRVAHVQHLPSWKGHICRAIVVVESVDT